MKLSDEDLLLKYTALSYAAQRLGKIFYREPEYTQRQKSLWEEIHKRGLTEEYFSGHITDLRTAEIDKIKQLFDEIERI